MLAGFAGAEVDRLAETKGADYIDRERAKRDAQQNAEQLYDSHYGGQDQYDPNMDPPQNIQDQFGGPTLIDRCGQRRTTRLADPRQTAVSTVTGRQSVLLRIRPQVSLLPLCTIARGLLIAKFA